MAEPRLEIRISELQEITALRNVDQLVINQEDKSTLKISYDNFIKDLTSRNLEFAGSVYVSGEFTSPVLDKRHLHYNQVDNVSELINDAGYLVKSQLFNYIQAGDNVSLLTNDAGYITESHVENILGGNGNNGGPAYLRKGQLDNVSELKNDEGYITGIDKLDAIGDVNVLGATANQHLVYDGNNWVAQETPIIASLLKFQGIFDVTVSGSPSLNGHPGYLAMVGHYWIVEKNGTADTYWNGLTTVREGDRIIFARDNLWYHAGNINEGGEKLELTDLSATNESAIKGQDSALSYNNTNGVFTYRKPYLDEFLTEQDVQLILEPNNGSNRYLKVSDPTSLLLNDGNGDINGARYPFVTELDLGDYVKKGDPTSDLTNDGDTLADGDKYAKISELPVNTNQLFNNGGVRHQGVDVNDTFAYYAEIPTKTSDLTNDGSSSDPFIGLASLSADNTTSVGSAGSLSYNNANGKFTFTQPTLDGLGGIGPSYVGDGEITLTRNGTEIGKFSMNQAGNEIIEISDNPTGGGGGQIISEKLIGIYEVWDGSNGVQYTHPRDLILSVPGDVADNMAAQENFIAFKFANADAPSVDDLPAGTEVTWSETPPAGSASGSMLLKQSTSTGVLVDLGIRVDGDSTYVICKLDINTHKSGYDKSDYSAGPDAKGPFKNNGITYGYFDVVFDNTKANANVNDISGLDPDGNWVPIKRDFLLRNSKDYTSELLNNGDGSSPYITTSEITNILNGGGGNNNGGDSYLQTSDINTTTGDQGSGKGAISHTLNGSAVTITYTPAELTEFTQLSASGGTANNGQLTYSSGAFTYAPAQLTRYEQLSVIAGNTTGLSYNAGVFSYKFPEVSDIGAAPVFSVVNENVASGNGSIALSTDGDVLTYTPPVIATSLAALTDTNIPNTIDDEATLVWNNDQQMWIPGTVVLTPPGVSYKKTIDVSVDTPDANDVIGDFYLQLAIDGSGSAEASAAWFGLVGDSVDDGKFVMLAEDTDTNTFPNGKWIIGGQLNNHFQSDWDVSNSANPAYINNKPDFALKSELDALGDNLDDRYVEVTGDTMTGNLKIKPSSGSSAQVGFSLTGATSGTLNGAIGYTKNNGRNMFVISTNSSVIDYDNDFGFTADKQLRIGGNLKDAPNITLDGINSSFTLLNAAISKDGDFSLSGTITGSWRGTHPSTNSTTSNGLYLKGDEIIFESTGGTLKGYFNKSGTFYWGTKTSKGHPIVMMSSGETKIRSFVNVGDQNFKADATLSGIQLSPSGTLSVAKNQISVDTVDVTAIEVYGGAVERAKIMADGRGIFTGTVTAAGITAEDIENSSAAAAYEGSAIKGNVMPLDLRKLPVLV